MLRTAIELLFFLLTVNAQGTNKFSCEGRPSGYYADMGTGCQVYHMCDGLGRQFSYSCPNATLFQQRMLICDHWYMVNCSKSESDYRANLLIGQKDKPFVEDSEKHPYHRTPRPDLLSNPNALERNIVYRTGRAQANSNLNLVGVDSDYDQNNGSTDAPAYFVPSHWSTEYVRDSTTQTPTIKGINYFLNQYRTTKDTININLNKKSDDTFDKAKSRINSKESKTAIPVNFKSFFKNTTPTFPKEVDLVTTETPTKTQPFGTIPPLSVEVEPPLEDDSYKYRNWTEEIRENISPPSMFYEPPNFEPDYQSSNSSQLDQHVQPSSKKPVQKKESGNYTSPEKNWKDLRKLFLIPDFEFPLDSAARPGYDGGVSSFQVNASSYGEQKSADS